MQINYSYNASVATAPAAFKTALQVAANVVSQAIVDPITVTLTVGWGETNGFIINPTTGSATGAASINAVSYADLRSALIANAQSNGYSYITSNLPITDPSNGNWFATSTAMAKVLGIPIPFTSIDGHIGFASTGVNWCYDTTQGIG